MVTGWERGKVTHWSVAMPSMTDLGTVSCCTITPSTITHAMMLWAVFSWNWVRMPVSWAPSKERRSEAANSLRTHTLVLEEAVPPMELARVSDIEIQRSRLSSVRNSGDCHSTSAVLAPPWYPRTWRGAGMKFLGARVVAVFDTP